MAGDNHRNFRLRMYVTMTTCLVCLCLLLFWLTVDRRPGSVIETAQFNSWEDPGHTFTMNVTGYRMRICDGYVESAIQTQDGNIIPFPWRGLPPSEIREKQKMGGFAATSYITIPTYVDMAKINGPVRYYQTVVFTNCNPLMRFFPVRMALPTIILPAPSSES